MLSSVQEYYSSFPPVHRGALLSAVGVVPQNEKQQSEPYRLAQVTLKFYLFLDSLPPNNK